MVKALNKAGFRIVHQRGSHIFLTDGKHKLTVPRHETIKRGTLFAILQQAGVDEGRISSIAKGKVRQTYILLLLQACRRQLDFSTLWLWCAYAQSEMAILPQFLSSLCVRVDFSIRMALN
jgi:predicted RNA binding protein YcfA (HicA-like mRNA interferase family)